jgi:adenylate cyclase
MRRLLHLIPWVVLALALFVRAQDPAPVVQLRNLVFDGFQRLSPRPFDAEKSPVRIVDIDDASLEKLGQWPWPRTLVAKLIDRLTEMGAAAIAFDVVFAEPDRTSPDRVLAQWPDSPEIATLRDQLGKLPTHDAILARSIGHAPVVTAFILVDKKTPRTPAAKGTFAMAGDDPRQFLPAHEGAVTNLPELEQAAAGNGAINWVPDRDQVVRTVPLMFKLGDKLYPNLVLEALRVALQAKTYVVKSSGSSGETAFGEHTGVVSVKVGDLVVPTDASGSMLVRFTPSYPQRYVPAWRVLEPDFKPDDIEGRIIFIGTSAAGLKDLRATPFAADTPGVEVHAQLVEQIVTGAFLERPDFAAAVELAFVLVIGAGLILLLTRIGAVWAGALGAGAIALACGVSWLAFLRFGWMVDPVSPSIAALLVFLTGTVVVYLQSEYQRQQVRGAFSRYMSPHLVERLAEHPEQLVLGGETRDMTIMFCDIRGFTTISEQYDAQGLTSMLNRFLTPMTEIILDREGTIDKYMGDAIMAFWNAPLDDPDHAEHACRTGLAMIARLKDLNAEWRKAAEAEGKPYHAINIGVGLNTGACSVGNMGSDQRFDYSVIGDDVNLASRLEGQSKTYGVDIVIGENTRAKVDGLAAIELDRLRVKGKNRPVRIYGLLGDETLAGQPEFQTLAQGHEAMLKAYRAQDWDAAERLADECRARAGGRLDGLYELYLERIADYRREPPPAGWDGVTVALTK